MSRASGTYVGVDLGGTSGRVATFASLDDPTPRKRRQFQAERDYQADLKSIAQAVKEVVGGATPAGVGFAMPGLLDSAGETITGSGRHERWHGRPIKKDLEALLGCPVVFRNDADAGALAEATYGEIKEDFWFIIWGTGVGGGLVEFRNGRPHIPPSEAGHQVIDWTDTASPDNCGTPGCWESFIGGDGLAMRYGKPAARLTEVEWKEVEVRVAQGVYNLMTARPVGRVVFGGGVALRQSKRLPAVEKILRERLKVVPAPQISAASHAEDAGLVGALAALAD